MSDVYFTSNPSEFSKLEGLYVSERNPPGFIRGRDQSVVGMAGLCVRGPTAPTEIRSSGEFLDIFGPRDYGSGGALKGQIWAAMLNKPFGKIVVRRVVASDATKASHIFANAVPTNIIRVDASSLGAWALNLVTAEVEDATDGNVNHFNLRATYRGQEVLYQNLSTNSTDDNLAAVIGSDPARFIDVVKLANGRPINATSALATGGSDGTLAVGDYESGVDDLAVYPGVSVVLVPEAVAGSAATFHSHIVTVAPTIADRIFLTWGQVHGQSVATEIAQVAAQITTRSDRIVWCYNSTYTVDPDTDAEFQQAPHVWLASVLSQIDVDIHAGSFETLAYLAGISRMTNTSLSRQDLIDLKNAGITTLERNTDGPQFRSAVVTDLTAGKTELARRREVDFLQLSAADRLRYYVKRKNTPEVRAAMAAELTGFSQDLKDRSRVVEDFEIDSDSVNTTSQRNRGEEHLLWRVKLIGHILSLVLETDISTGTVIERAA